MNKKMILPLAGLILLIGAILLTIYFKNIEKSIERQNKNINQLEDGLKTNNLESENKIMENSAVNIEEIDALEKDFSDMEDLINDPVVENLDLDIGSF